MDPFDPRLDRRSIKKAFSVYVDDYNEQKGWGKPRKNYGHRGLLGGNPSRALRRLLRRPYLIRQVKGEKRDP